MPFIFPLPPFCTAGLLWLDCVPVTRFAVPVAFLTTPIGRDDEMLPGDEETVAETGRPADTGLPVDLPDAVSLFLIEGVVLTTVDLFAETLFEGFLEAFPEDAVTLFGVSLPVFACPLVNAAVFAWDSFLLTVLRLPIPPLTEEPLANTRSEPVRFLGPCHTFLSWSCAGPP